MMAAVLPDVVWGPTDPTSAESHGTLMLPISTAAVMLLGATSLLPRLAQIGAVPQLLGNAACAEVITRACVGVALALCRRRRRRLLL